MGPGNYAPLTAPARQILVSTCCFQAEVARVAIAVLVAAAAAAAVASCPASAAAFAAAAAGAAAIVAIEDVLEHCLCCCGF